MSSINVSVLNTLCDYASGSVENTTESGRYDISVCNLILSKLSGVHKMFKNFVHSIEEKNINKKHIIKMGVICKQVENDTKFLIKQLEDESVQPIMRNWKFKESKLFSMIIWAIRISESNDINPYELYDCIMSLSVAMNEFNISDNSSSDNIENLSNKVYGRLTCYTFLDIILHDYSELIVSNFYTNNYLVNVIKPYPAQKNVIDIYNQSLKENKPVCINYSTETGSGKTYLSLALAKALKNSSTYKADDPNNAFIFVCYNITVRKMIVDMCDKLNIPACLVEINGINYVGNKGPCFILNRCATNIKVKNEGRGNARSRVGSNGGLKVKTDWRKFDDLILNGTDEEKIRNQFIYLMSIKDHTQSFNSNTPQVYICDPESASHFVKIAPGATVFIDEPDVDDEQMSQYYASILEQYPKRVIISSATIGSIDNYLSKFQEVHPSSLVTTVNHGTAGIHTTLVVNGKIVMPHMFVNFDDKNSYNLFLHQLSNTSIIKLYSPIATIRIVRFYNKHVSPDNELALENYFSWRTINYNNLRTFIIKFFNCYYQHMHCIEKENIDSIYTWHFVNRPFTYDNNLLTGQTLAISNNPVLQAIKWEDGLFNIDSDNVYNIKEARRIYLDELKIYNSVMQKIKSNTSARESRQIVENNIAEHSRNQPYIRYPSASIIGSKAHMERFSLIGKSSRTKYCGVDERLFDSVDEEILKWLYAGVGFYDNSMPKPYITSVLNAAQSCELAFMISTPELVRGMDYRFDTVMIDKNFGNNASQSTLRQTIGRVGRPGSNKALVILEDMKSVNKLFNENDLSLIKQLIDKFKVPNTAKNNNAKKIKKFTLSINNKIVENKLLNEDVSDTIPDNWYD